MAATVERHVFLAGRAVVKGEAEKSFFVLLRYAVVNALGDVEKRRCRFNRCVVFEDLYCSRLHTDEDAVRAVARPHQHDRPRIRGEAFVGPRQLIVPYEIRKRGLNPHVDRRLVHIGRVLGQAPRAA